MFFECMMQGFFGYILLCANEVSYVSSTDDLKKRITGHQSKKFSGYTSTRLSIKLVCHCAFTAREEAFSAESRIKKWSPKKETRSD